MKIFKNNFQIRNYLKFANVNRSRSGVNSSAYNQSAKRRLLHREPRAETLDSMDDFDDVSDVGYESPVGPTQTYVDPYETGIVPIDDDDEGVLTGVDARAKFYPLFPTFEICHNGRLDGFVNSMTLLPQVATTLANKNILDVVNELVGLDATNKADRLEFYYVSAGPVAGGYYLSTLLFRHCLFESEPIVPAAYLIHERKSPNDHKRLFEMLRAKCPEVSIKKNSFRGFLLFDRIAYIFLGGQSRLRFYYRSRIRSNTIDFTVGYSFIQLALF